jgi:hypothetical protein
MRGGRSGWEGKWEWECGWEWEWELHARGGVRLFVARRTAVHVSSAVTLAAPLICEVDTEMSGHSEGGQ